MWHSWDSYLGNWGPCKELIHLLYHLLKVISRQLQSVIWELVSKANSQIPIPVLLIQELWGWGILLSGDQAHLWSLLKQTARSHPPPVSGSAGLGWHPRMCISKVPRTYFEKLCSRSTLVQWPQATPGY